MKPKNRTLLLSLLSRCHQLIEDPGIDINGHQINGSFFGNTESPLFSVHPVSTISSSRETYDNAYFYILFVMIFYSVLAMTLFKCFISSNEDEKDPHEEFMCTKQPLMQKFNTDHTAEFYFEEENGL